MKSCLLFLWMMVCVADGVANERPTRPNVILIVGESHRAEALGMAGNTFVKTPCLDALAATGVRFSHAYVTTAICSVSRASILSGQHRARHGINDFSSDFSDEALQQTLPIVLKNAGYALGWVGFFGVGKNPPGAYFDLWEPGIPWKDADGVHHTDAVARTAMEWLESDKGAKPFFLQLNFNAAHEIDPTREQPAHYLVQDRFRGLYADVDVPVPRTADPRIWESFPDFFRTDRNIARQRWHGFFSSPDLFQRNAKDYYRMITGVDEAVGSVIRKLEVLGLAENTIVIYTSDHGFSLGEHGIMGKWYPFDNSIHVPLLIHDPRQTELAGTEADAIALNIDLAPTILGMVGVPAPAAMQGVNLMPVIKGQLPGRSQFFYEHTVFSSPLLPKVEAVITKRLRYVKYIEHDYEALYDFEKDPDESRNLVHDPAYANDLAEMRALYRAERIGVRHPHRQ
mgnify:FL=1|jgi:Arylsulfatase A and related enzymes